MRGRTSAIEQPGRGKHERTGADGEQTSAGSVGGTQRIDERCRYGHIDALPAGNHDGAGCTEAVQTAVDAHADTVLAVDLAALGCTGFKAIPAGSKFRPRQAKDLGGAREFEGT